MRRSLIFWTLISLAAAFAACGGEPGPQIGGHVPSMLNENDSQYALTELRVHYTDSYLGAENVLPEPLAVDGELLFFGVGAPRFTVMREKYEHGPILAFTTAEPV